MPATCALLVIGSNAALERGAGAFGRDACDPAR